MNVLGTIFLNSRKDRRKDGVFLLDVEELTFLKKQQQYFLVVVIYDYKIYIFDSDLVWRIQLIIIKGYKSVLCV